MRQFAKIAIFGAMVFAGSFSVSFQPSFAQEATQDVNWRELLNDLYRLDLAIDRCETVTPTGGELIQLEDAIGYVERRADMPKDSLDEVYARLEYETVADRNDFCQAMTNAVDEIRKIPADYRD